MSKVIPLQRTKSGLGKETPTNETSPRPPPERKPKWGAGSFSAWMRQGLKELRSLIFTHSPHGRDAELGMWGTATPHEVWNSRTKKPPAKEIKAMNNPNQAAPEQEPSHSIVDDRIAQAQAEQEQQHQHQQEPPHEPEK